MNKKIKHVSELPKWFNIKNYQYPKKLTLACWAEQLHGRMHFRNVVLDDAYSSNRDKESPEFLIFKNFLLEVIKSICIDPFNTHKNEKLSELFKITMPPFKDFDPSHYLGVRNLFSSDFLTIADMFNPEQLKYLNKLSNMTSEEKIISITLDEHPEWFNTPIHKITQNDIQMDDPVLIDLTLPDTLLIKHFKTYLKIRRMEKKIETIPPKRFSQNDIENWKKSGVLPYLDLKIWELIENISIPNRIIADAIFLNGEGGEETIRKTTAVIADLFKKEDYIKIIAAQVTEEALGERNKKS